MSKEYFIFQTFVSNSSFFCVLILVVSCSKLVAGLSSTRHCRVKSLSLFLYAVCTVYSLRAKYLIRKEGDGGGLNMG